MLVWWCNDAMVDILFAGENAKDVVENRMEKFYSKLNGEEITI